MYAGATPRLSLPAEFSSLVRCTRPRTPSASEERPTSTPAAPHPQTYKRCQLRRFRAGQTILRPRQARHKLALLIEGLASYRIEMLDGRSASGRGHLGEAATSTGQMVSGLCFDMSECVVAD